MKLIYIFILSLFLFSCNGNDPNSCINKGALCDEYPEDYLRCKRYEYYNNDHYNHTVTTYIYIQYRIKDTENDEWTYWETYSEMYDHYCFSNQNTDDI